MDIISSTDNYTGFSDNQKIESKFFSGNIPMTMNLSSSTHIYGSKGYYDINDLEIYGDIDVISDKDTIINTKSFSLNNYPRYRLVNTIIHTKVLNLRSASSIIHNEILATHVNVESGSLNHFKGIKDVNSVRIYYSLSEIPLLKIDYFPVKNETLAIQCINNAEIDQIFSEQIIDGISIDILCFNSSNLKKFDVEFKSQYWQFDGKTRLFDLYLRKRENYQCFALEKIKPVSPTANSKVNIYLVYVLPMSAGILILGVLILSAIIYRRHRSKSLNSFISSDFIAGELTRELI